jgi:hypothetical protein
MCDHRRSFGLDAPAVVAGAVHVPPDSERLYDYTICGVWYKRLSNSLKIGIMFEQLMNALNRVERLRITAVTASAAVVRTFLAVRVRPLTSTLARHFV